MKICPLLHRLFLTKRSHSRWWSLRILPVTSSSTPTGPALSRTKESSLSKGRSSQYLWMRSISLPSYHFTPFRGQDFDLTEFITYGDIYPNALDHFCAWVEEVSEWKNKESSSHLFRARSLSPFFGTRPTCSNIPIVSRTTSRSRYIRWSLVFSTLRWPRPGARTCNGSFPNKRAHQGEDIVAFSSGLSKVDDTGDDRKDRLK